jgi:hypothetical protein
MWISVDQEVWFNGWVKDCEGSREKDGMGVAFGETVKEGDGSQDVGDK